MRVPVPEHLEAQFWSRHSNPKSGWSRVPTGPLLVYALYRRRWRLFAAGVLWAAINPFVFAPPETDDAWMTRAVLAERWWTRQEEHGTIGLSSPNICNAASLAATVYAIYGAMGQRPGPTALGTALAAGFKLWWLREITRRYDDITDSG